MEKKTQNQRVLEVIKRQGYITNFQAMRDMYILRLGARIKDLIDDGLIELDEAKTDFIEGTKNYKYVLKVESPYRETISMF